MRSSTSANASSAETFSWGRIFPNLSFESAFQAIDCSLQGWDWWPQSSASYFECQPCEGQLTSPLGCTARVRSIFPWGRSSLWAGISTSWAGFSNWGSSVWINYLIGSASWPPDSWVKVTPVDPRPGLRTFSCCLLDLASASIFHG